MARNNRTLSLMLSMALVFASGLGGCTMSALNAGQAALVQMAVTIAVADLCKYGNNQYSKLGNPSSAIQIGKAHMDAVCNDPSATAGTLVAGYNSFATTINAPKAVVVDTNTVTVAVPAAS